MDDFNFIVKFEDSKLDEIKLNEVMWIPSGKVNELRVYSLLDAVVDNYFVVLEKRGEDMEKVEDQIIVNPQNEISREIHQLKRDIIYRDFGHFCHTSKRDYDKSNKRISLSYNYWAQSSFW